MHGSFVSTCISTEASLLCKGPGFCAFGIQDLASKRAWLHRHLNSRVSRLFPTGGLEILRLPTLSLFRSASLALVQPRGFVKARDVTYLSKTTSVTHNRHQGKIKISVDSNGECACLYSKDTS